MTNPFKRVPVSLVLLAACGGAGPVATDASSSAALTSSTAVRIQLRGDDATGFSSFKLAAQSLTAEGDGVPIAVAVNHAAVELTNTGQAWQIGTFTIPAGVHDVTVTLRLANPGSVTDAGGSAGLDTRGPPISFSGPATLFAQQTKATVHLDLVKSTSPESQALRWMVPELAVHF